MTAATVVRLDDVDSTQRVAKELARDGAAHGTCVVAKSQTAGRGRLGRSWVAPKDGLFVSFVLRPGIRAAQAPRIALTAAHGLLHALRSLGIDAHIKWPNDVVIPRPDAPIGPIGAFRKVAGILVETVAMTAHSLDCAILGIGVNVRAPDGGFGSELDLTAGALADGGYAGEREEVLQAVLQHVVPAIDEGVTDVGFVAVLASLRQHSATLGNRIQVEIDGQKRAVQAVDLDVDGALVVRDDDGQDHTVRAGDVWLV